MAKKQTAEKMNNEKKHRGGFVLFLVLAFVLIVVANVIFSYGNRLNTTIVRSGQENDSISGTGYIFREQTVINAPNSGYLYCEAEEDERVSLGEPVMYIYKNEINLSANSELKAVEDEISRLSEQIHTADVYSSDAARLEQSVAKLLRDAPKYGAEGDLGGAAVLADEVDLLIEKRRIINGEIQPLDRDAELQSLKAQKAELEKKYNIERTAVHAPKTGAFSSRLDGLEQMLSQSSLDKVNDAYLKELDKLYTDAKTADKAEQGQPIGKIVNNFKWSVVVQVPKTSAEGLRVGSEIGIKFSDISSEAVRGSVTKISPEEAGSVILTVTSNSYVDMIYSTSRINVELIKNSYEGLRIPAKSLRMQGEQMGVYVIRSNKARFIPVELLYSDKDWVIAKEQTESYETPKVLKLYDELIVEGKEIYEGKVMR